MIKAFITVNGKELPIKLKMTTQQPTPIPSYNFSEEVKRLSNAKVIMQGTWTPTEGPTGPVVEGSVEKEE